MICSASWFVGEDNLCKDDFLGDFYVIGDFIFSSFLFILSLANLLLFLSHVVFWIGMVLPFLNIQGCVPLLLILQVLGCQTISNVM